MQNWSVTPDTRPLKWHRFHSLVGRKWLKEGRGLNSWLLVYQGLGDNVKQILRLAHGVFAQGTQLPFTGMVVLKSHSITHTVSIFNSGSEMKMKMWEVTPSRQVNNFETRNGKRRIKSSQSDELKWKRKYKGLKSRGRSLFYLHFWCQI